MSRVADSPHAGPAGTDAAAVEGRVRAAGAPRVLVLGYGNPARGDDGLGPALAERVEALHLPGVVVETDYQLCIEHAALAAEHDVVVFADACVDADAAFAFGPVAPAPDEAFCTHAVTPGQVLRLATTCFGAAPRAYLLGLRARAIEGFDEGLTTEAQAGLDAGLRHLVGFIEAETGHAR